MQHVLENSSKVLFSLVEKTYDADWMDNISPIVSSKFVASRTHLGKTQEFPFNFVFKSNPQRTSLLPSKKSSFLFFFFLFLGIQTAIVQRIATDTSFLLLPVGYCTILWL